jgi:hypothetical protein
MICVARKARRASSKLWHGRKDDEYLGLWDTFLQARFGRRRQETFDKKKACETKGQQGRLRLLMRTGPSQGSLMWINVDSMWSRCGVASPVSPPAALCTQ